MSSFENWTDRELERCPFGFVFEESSYHYPGTVVAEFATVCERDWLVPAGTTLFLFGLALGMVISGWIGDQIGRKKTVILFSVIELLAGVWTSLSPNVVNYILARTLMGIGNLGKANAANILILEITTAKYRSLMTSSFALGTNFLFRSLIALWAFWIPNWRWLNLTTLSPHLLTIFYAHCLPESPRWLMSQNESLEAVKVLKKGYLINHLRSSKPGMETLNDLEELITDGHIKAGTNWTRSLRSIRPPSTRQCLQSLIKSFSTPSLAKTTSCCIVIYAGISTSFFGLLYYARILYGSVYLNGFLNATTALPAAILTTLLYRYSRYRKRPLVGLISLALITLAVGSGYTVMYRSADDTVLTVCSNIALLLHITIKGMFAVYMPELFPSEVRTQGYGVATGIGRFISMSCLFLNELDKVTVHGVPLLIYSSMLLVTLVALTVLPETSGENLSDLGKKQNRQKAETELTQRM
ncbi:Transporter major facilitator family protein [Paragonimus heterotremus]|uniref:Transporter major facilitator family protein n=1 Tax=Paragonimus heterotremus TaxID=100268 RepID=A0A8J4SZS4_9TREM|nr:Transporter major facilitator family protein [Paragonimus heterotremus]